MQPEGWPYPYTYRAYVATVDTFAWQPARWNTLSEQSHRWGHEHTLPAKAAGTIGQLPPGPCRIRLWTDDYEDVRHVTFVEGTTTMLEFNGR